MVALSAERQRMFKERFAPDPSGCWLWTGGLTTTGYGSFLVEGKIKIASRIAYELFVGEIPDGLCVLHRCDVRACVRPSHLFLGTKGDNNRDGAAKGRYPAQQRTHCPSGHAYDTENTYIYKRQRFCRACHRVSVAARP